MFDVNGKYEVLTLGQVRTPLPDRDMVDADVPL